LADCGEGELWATVVLSEGAVAPSVELSDEVSLTVSLELQPTRLTAPKATKNPTLRIEADFDAFIYNLQGVFKKTTGQ
jgi:hypothetical protein